MSSLRQRLLYKRKRYEDDQEEFFEMKIITEDLKNSTKDLEDKVRKYFRSRIRRKQKKGSE